VISGLFLLASLVVIVAPGPDSAVIAQTVLRYGRRLPAFAAAAGMITAGAGHAAVSITGVALVVQRNASLFTGLRWVGAAVLLGWGVWALWHALRGEPPVAPRPPPPSLRRAFLLGFASTAVNPKVGLFLLAFLPQFVPPGVAPVPALTLLAAVYLALGTAWLTVLTELVYQFRSRLFSGVGLRAAQGVAGGLFVVLAVRLALG
jgi:threonine/homoserine/homoserine lactone efflux protein